MVAEDQVAYGTGGRWGEWSGGGGSSLELIDPRSNHRLASNWADSDETQKSVWTNIEITGVLDNGGNYDPSIDYAQIGLLDAGECLVDNIEVDYNGTNYVSNGTFEGGTELAIGRCKADMVRSSLESTGYQSSSFAAHPVQRPDLDRGQFLRGGTEHQHAGRGQDRDVAFQSALAAWLAGTAVAPEWQLAGSHRRRCRCRPISARRECPTASISPMPGRRFTMSRITRRCRRPVRRSWSRRRCMIPTA